MIREKVEREKENSRGREDSAWSQRKYGSEGTNVLHGNTCHTLMHKKNEYGSKLSDT